VLKHNLFQLYFALKNLVLPPGRRPYGPEAGPDQSSPNLPEESLQEFEVNFIRRCTIKAKLGSVLSQIIEVIDIFTLWQISVGYFK